MKRGDIVIAAVSGDYGKPRPYIVVQSDAIMEADSVILCPITSDVREAPFRLPIPSGPATGLREKSQAMTEKLLAARRTRIARVIGRLDADTMGRLDVRLAFVLGLSG